VVRSPKLGRCDLEDTVTYASEYFKIVEEYEQHVSPEIISALSRIDKNKDPTQQKKLFADAAAAFNKWNGEFIAEQKNVTDNDEKLHRSQFLGEVSKMKQSVQADSTKPPYKPTTLCADFMKVRAAAPVGRTTIALWALDKATTPGDAQPLAAIALRALNDELATIDFDRNKVKDPALKKQLQNFADDLRKQLVPKLTELSKK
jgi:hypothetical protein